MQKFPTFQRSEPGGVARRDFFVVWSISREFSKETGKAGAKEILDKKLKFQQFHSLVGKLKPPCEFIAQRLLFQLG